MLKKTAIIILLLCSCLGVAGHSAEKDIEKHGQQEIAVATILGSAETPDPILARVLELERAGILTNVVVMESFPVQIEVTGPKSILNELKSMPRKSLVGP